MKRAVLGSQYVSRMCAVCGIDNPSSLRARFFELEGDELLGVFEPSEVHQGYPGRLHGGIATALIDETIGRAITIHDPGAWGVTVEITVKFRQPVPVVGEVRAIARIVGDTSRRLFRGTGEIVLSDGSVAVQAEGRYLKMPLDRIAQGDVGVELRTDPSDTPTSIDLAR